MCCRGKDKRLCLGLAKLGDVLLPLRQGATAVEDLDTSTVGDQTVLLLEDGILLTGVLGEAPVAGHNHQLTARELELERREKVRGRIGLRRVIERGVRCECVCV